MIIFVFGLDKLILKYVAHYSNHGDSRKRPMWIRKLEILWTYCKIVGKGWNMSNTALEPLDIQTGSVVTHNTTFTLFEDITKKNRDPTTSKL